MAAQNPRGLRLSYARLNSARATVGITPRPGALPIRETVTGRVRISTTTEIIDEIRTQQLHGTQMDVVWVPVDRMLEPGEVPPVARTEGGVTIIPIFEEVAVVETRIVLKEELRITQRETTESVDIPLTLRKQSATIERTGSEE